MVLEMGLAVGEKLKKKIFFSAGQIEYFPLLSLAAAAHDMKMMIFSPCENTRLTACCSTDKTAMLSETSLQQTHCRFWVKKGVF